MVKLYATVEGSRVRVGNYGEATFDAPIEVPAEVAAELAGDPLLKVEDEKPKKAAPAATKEK